MAELPALPADRNFDDLAARFRRNVYDRLKGDIRLAVLRRDLAEAVPGLASLGDADAPPGPPLRILDAGGGQGQLSLALAGLGHRVALCDISAAMLDLARENFAKARLGDGASFHHESIQAHCARHPEAFDLVLCHAVLEWVADPEALLASLRGALRPGGFLSLTFYNVNGLIMKNLLRANFAKVVAEDYRGYRGSLTPANPLRPEQVRHWLDALGLPLVGHSGIRCFHDYILDPAHRNRDPATQIELELRLSREDPFRGLGRYIHLLTRRP
ncbi:MAG: methyltransferase domain-containing protein [Porticoccaceae bacterium]|jgi:S-adenosylmethionine-dependent methyltransferase|nr:methyltransferase domain-containing protein [Porticoccaceae bacterium]